MHLKSLFLSTSATIFLTGLITPVQPAACIKKLKEINDKEMDIMYDVSSVTNRTYNLCSNTVFEVGGFNWDYDVYAPDDFDKPPLTIFNGNIRILCGDNGLLSDNCTLSGGSIQVDIDGDHNYQRANLNPDSQSKTTFVENHINIVLKGLTFANLKSDEDDVNNLSDGRANIWMQWPQVEGYYYDPLTRLPKDDSAEWISELHVLDCLFHVSGIPNLVTSNKRRVV